MLKTRIITAAVLSLGFLSALFLASSNGWALLTLSVTLIATWEWSKLLKLNNQQMLCNLAAILSVCLLAVFISSEVLVAKYPILALLIIGLAAIFWVLFAPIWLARRWKIENKLIMSILGIVLLSATWIAFNALRNESAWLLLSVIGAVSLADSAAYFAGKRFGRHKLAPEISPGKTWEGVAGAIVAGTFYGFLLCYFTHHSVWLIAGIWGIVLFSIMGDLFESLLKRQADVKDSSHLLPGHGGVLDRIDGLIPALPLALFFVLIAKYFHLTSVIAH